MYIDQNYKLHWTEVKSHGRSHGRKVLSIKINNKDFIHSNQFVQYIKPVTTINKTQYLIKSSKQKDGMQQSNDKSY